MPLDGPNPVSAQCQRERHETCRRPNACDCECHDPEGTVRMPVRKGHQFACGQAGCDRLFDSEQGARVHYSRVHGPAAVIRTAAGREVIPGPPPGISDVAAAAPIHVRIDVPPDKVGALIEFLRALR